MELEWYPGHMEKARRQMKEDMRLIDLVVSIIDCRIPYSSINPSLDSLTENKRKLIILNKEDLADPNVTKLWENYYTEKNIQFMTMDALDKRFKNTFLNNCEKVCVDKLERDKRRGIRNSRIRAMIIGIPNVGKSTLINMLSGKSAAKTGNKPGVTRGKQWIHTKGSIDFLDTPGVLWPKFEDPIIGEHLAFVSAIRNELIPFRELADNLIKILKSNYPNTINSRYNIDEDLDNNEILAMLAKKRGYLLKQGEPDIDKVCEIMVQEFRTGKLGRISLERPEDFEV